MYRTGEHPGKGYYKCKQCGEVIHLEHDTDRLPTCPHCNAVTSWQRM